jgi:hypothetical protein
MVAEGMGKVMPKLMPALMEGFNMTENMPKLRDKVMPVVMPKMMEVDTLREKLPGMMMEMMPKCVDEVLPEVPKEKRIDFVLERVPILIEQGSIGMSKKEKDDFVAKVIEKVKT